MSKIRVCLFKVMPTKGDLAGNMAKLEHVLKQVPDCGIDVLITPEGYLDGYVSTKEYVDADNIADYGVQEGNVYLTRAAQIAVQRGAWFVFGCIHNTAQGPKNAALVFDRRGQIAGRYYKVHCQTHDGKYTPGSRLPVFESDFGLFGVMICADRRWPETVRTLALKGARVIFNPTYGMHDDRNLHMMQTRWYESEVVIAFTHPQQSLVTGPLGEIVCNDRSADARFSVTDVDLSEVDRVRGGESGHLRDRRGDLYQL